MDYRLITISSGWTFLVRVPFLVHLEEVAILSRRLDEGPWLEGGDWKHSNTPLISVQWYARNKLAGSYRLRGSLFLDIEDVTEEDAVMILFQMGERSNDL